MSVRERRYPATIEEVLGLLAQQRLTLNAFDICISARLMEDIGRRIKALEEARRA